jgi:hypothetical protein
MTLFDVKQFSEITATDWSFDTLRPPLRPSEVLWDLRNQWRAYVNGRLPFFRRVGFLVLRIFQRFAYNWGWVFYRVKSGIVKI